MTTMAPQRRIARLYRTVPADQLARLEAFRARAPYRQARIGATTWHYIDAGAGEQVILALSGAACIAEISWETISFLAQHHRVIAPDYPAIDGMAALVDGIAALLDQLGIDRVHVMGGSYGGFVAQLFVRRHPGRTASLVLSHTLVPSADTARKVGRTLRWLQLLPQPLLRTLFRVYLGALFPKTHQRELALGRALFGEIVSTRLSKAQIVSVLRRVVDLGRNYQFTPDDLRDWPGPVLLLMAEDDPATPTPVRQAMAALYPQAELRLFSGSGHLTAILQQDQYLDAIERFLAAAPMTADA